MSRKKLVVVGGGAAGFFCAVNAARLNPLLEVIILEKTNKLLSKVKVSGGGRCNVTHNCFDVSEMSKSYPRGSNFVKKTFYQFFTPDTVKWFAERGVPLKTESDGRMFPVTDSSQTIIECLLREADKYGVKIKLNREVKSLISERGGFTLELNNDSPISCDFVCIACGGYPKQGMFDWIKLTGHLIEKPVPSLFTFNTPGNSIRELMGISVERVRVKLAGLKLEQEGPLLITHWGLSGPAILKLSAWGARELAKSEYRFTTIINWIPDFNEHTLKNQIQEFRKIKGGQKIGSRNSFALPQRLWEFLLNGSDIKTKNRWGDLTSSEQNKLIKNLLIFEINISGKTTFKEEFVTCGGVKLSEVDPQTMMSRKMHGLYFGGEVLDVDGITGGFNFQYAWTSGFIAAKSIASSF
ncbi:MAG TPA: NAD(P)/FAD-dependent oxidoreductase [Chitinophagaceae bacterium]|nr:NAD(P)/FAD-dependent oxidoreductase [Chitinophagaceae bacterium]